MRSWSFIIIIIITIIETDLFTKPTDKHQHFSAHHATLTTLTKLFSSALPYLLYRRKA